jgi:phosphoesterase RecJ-like protein
MKTGNSGVGKTDLQEISEIIKKADTLALYPHVNMDGDTLGSCMALCLALKAMGKKVDVIIDDAIPDNLKFLDDGSCTEDLKKGEGVDIACCLDCADRERLGKRGTLFPSAGITVSIDHHMVANPFCDYNYTDTEAAATGEIVYKLLEIMDFPGSKEAGNALFTAITTDTGNFQYSNTRGETHRIMAKLYDWGIEPDRVSVLIYDSNRPERLMLESLSLSRMELLLGGKVAISYVSQKMLEQAGAEMYESERIVNELRSIAGVEVSCLVKENSIRECKVSMRSKNDFDISLLASKFHGGGHKKAAGFTLNKSLDQAMLTVKNALLESEIGKKEDA